MKDAVASKDENPAYVQLQPLQGRLHGEEEHVEADQVVVEYPRLDAGAVETDLELQVKWVVASVPPWVADLTPSDGVFDPEEQECQAREAGGNLEQNS